MKKNFEVKGHWTWKRELVFALHGRQTLYTAPWNRLSIYRNSQIKKAIAKNLLNSVQTLPTIVIITECRTECHCVQTLDNITTTKKWRKREILMDNFSSLGFHS